MKKIDQERALNEAVDAEEKARLEAEEKAKYVDIPEPPLNDQIPNPLPPPDGYPPAYCPPLREGRIITGRAGGNVQIPSAVAGAPPAPGQA